MEYKTKTVSTSNIQDFASEIDRTIKSMNYGVQHWRVVNITQPIKDSRDEFYVFITFEKIPETY